ncbi:unnamed protein product [Meloidogyne enterolobii]|uniref:Uncharacterized protein n=2 Tax=Meloidogyne enterolobii TaxID=390850 RepID=A0ACB1AHL5_MELEN
MKKSLFILFYLFFNFGICGKPPKTKGITSTKEASPSSNLLEKFVGLSEDDLEGKYIEAFFGKEKPWKEIIRQISSFLLFKKINDKKLIILNNLTKEIKRKGKSLFEIFEEEEEKKASDKEIKNILGNYEKFKEKNKNETKIEFNFLLKLLEFNELFELFESEMSGGEFKLKIIKEKFVKIENKLKDLGEEEDLSKVDDIFKSSLAELHLER